MNFDDLLIDIDARGVATVTLNRPAHHNALNASLISNLSTAAGEFAENPAVRVVVLTGKGASFCAGGDLGWMKDQFEAIRSERIEQALGLAQMLDTWNRLPKPVIARVQGSAFGGGIGLISICDIAVAVVGAKFGLTEARLGLVPATISPFLSARLGEGACRDLWLTAHAFDATRATELGLLRCAIDAANFDASVEAIIEDLLARSPRAIADAKALARSLGKEIDAKLLHATANALADHWETADAVEGVSAFFDKRQPSWPSLRQVD